MKLMHIGPAAAASLVISAAPLAVAAQQTGASASSYGEGVAAASKK